MRTAAQTAFFMAILTLISKCIGFVREMVMANYFGTTYVTDAYVMSSTILSVLFGGVISSISIAYIPMLSRINEKSGEKLGDEFTSRIISLLLVITFFISITGIFFSDQIISVFARGFSGEAAKLAAFFVKVLFSYVIFSSVSSILEAHLQYKGIFLPQIISGYFISLCTIIAIVVSALTSYYYLAFGLLAGYFLRFIALYIIAVRKGYQHCLTLNDRTAVRLELKEILSLSIPTFIGSYMMYINQFIDKSLASKLTEGSIAALNYAFLLNGMIMGMTITILATIIYPKLAKANSLEQYDRFNSLLGTGITIVILIALPFSLGAMLYNEQLVQIVYERGVFDQDATRMTSSAFLFYSMGLVFMSINDLMIRTYYSMHRMKMPMIFAGIGVLINIILNLILIKSMAHNGLALATSIASCATSLMLLAGLRYKCPQVQLLLSKMKLMKIVLASVIAVSSSYFVYHYFVMPNSDIIVARVAQLLIPVVVAAVIYLALLIAFKVDEIKLIKQIIKP